MTKKKIITRALFLLLLLAGLITLFVFRWKVWFFDAEEEVYCVAAAPHNVVITLGEDAVSERTISWRAGDTIATSFLLLSRGETLQQPDTILADGQIISTVGGQAAYYHVALTSLLPGVYTYVAQTDSLCSDPFSFVVSADSICDFVLLGDLQAPFADNQTGLQTPSADNLTGFFRSINSHLTEGANQSDSSVMRRIDAYLYTGDILASLTDTAWQQFFTSVGETSATIPQVVALGEHEYQRTILHSCDARWSAVFVNPKNGPQHFEGKSYYIDYPSARIIVLDTEGVRSLSGLLQLTTWFTHALQHNDADSIRDHSALHKWTIVLMHHPIFSAGMNRDNPFLFAALHYAVRHADLVIAGHDHCYASRRHRDLKHYVNSNEPVFTTPISVVTSSTSASYLPKCHTLDGRLGANNAFFSTIHLSPDSLLFSTYLLDEPTSNNQELKEDAKVLLYDQIICVREDAYKVVMRLDSLPGERLELPLAYQADTTMRVRRFLNRRDARIRNKNN